MPETTGNRPLRVTIYGSCVSRDTVDLAAHDRIEVAGYVARQSVLSIGNDASARFPQDAAIDSPFQRRMMEGDFAGNAAQRILEEAPHSDLLLWDLADERHGVQAYLDGDVVTRSIDVMKSPEVKAALTGSLHVPFGDDEHFETWKASADALHATLEEAGLTARTVVLAVPWALCAIDGSETPASMGITPADANERFARYYDHLRDLGLRMIELDVEDVHSDPEHRWGHSPFHYAQDVYERIAEALLSV
ncbi:hypothetical protein DEO23_05690 [Brachybacterium endophyticum]|uniref:SGNH hydrolase-type esterase domain-containing protein n=1 Tax=Brachybacterium endophyticum TaxID=2182385 RepID=A0A2U2RKQ6_9MICO|nr:DUF6270 domain-containing protein [Brachybacterium endophyticum]PWH06462.1 hypothetical protein DEO23_05690 [Brachybacterium endophyticum]